MLVGAQTILHEAVHSKDRPFNSKANSPEKLRALTTETVETGSYMFFSPRYCREYSALGFSVSDIIFGGEILPFFQGEPDQKATLADEDLFTRPLRFAPAVSSDLEGKKTSSKSVGRSYYMIDDTFAIAFTRKAANGDLSKMIDETDLTAPPLHPHTIDAQTYSPPTIDEIKRLCGNLSLKQSAPLGRLRSSSTSTTPKK